jgi:hypothetical protein
MEIGKENLSRAILSKVNVKEFFLFQENFCICYKTRVQFHSFQEYLVLLISFIEEITIFPLCIHLGTE